jgi:hypothetical protein
VNDVKRPSPIKHPYLMTDSTMIQARMANATLLANTSGTNRSQLSLDQGACVGSRSGQVAARERPVPYRLVAKLSRGVSWEAIEFPSWRSSCSLIQRKRQGQRVLSQIFEKVNSGYRNLE